MYVLSRMGNSRAALRLIISAQQDIPRAIEFVRLQRDEELWEELIDWALGNADTTGGQRVSVRPEGGCEPAHGVLLLIATQSRTACVICYQSKHPVQMRAIMLQTGGGMDGLLGNLAGGLEVAGPGQLSAGCWEGWLHLCVAVRPPT